MKIVINNDWGGFGLSEEAEGLLFLRGGNSAERHNSILVEVVEELGDRANDAGSSLCVVEIPDESTDYTVMDYDGQESVLYVLNGKIHWA